MLITPFGFRNTRVFGVPPAPPSSSGELDFLQTATSGSDLTTYTFSSQNFGSEDDDRYIAVTIYGRASTVGRTLSSVTIGGIDAPIVQDVELSDSPNTQKGAVALAKVPSGASGDVVVTWGGSMLRCGIAVYRLVGLESRIPTVVTSQLTASQTDVTMNVDIPANSAVIAMVGNAGTGTEDWTGVTEDYGEDIEFSRFTGGSQIYLNSSDSQAIECDMTSATAKSFGVCVIWQLGTVSYPILGAARWWDSNDIDTLFQDNTFTTPITADGQLVGGWLDKVVGAKVGNSSTVRPTYKEGIQNSLPIIRFDGGDSLSGSTDSGSVFQNVEYGYVFIVLKSDLVTTADRAAFYASNGTSNSQVRLGLYDGRPGNKFSLLKRRLDGDSFSEVTSELDHAAEYRVVTAISTWTNGGMVLRQNGSVVANGTLGTSGRTSNSSSLQFRIGSASDSGGTQSIFFDGDIAEIILYNTQLTQEEIELNEQYLANKWGISIEYNPNVETGFYAHWDFSDLDTLFQDTGETTPAASNDDPIGRAKDLGTGGFHADQATAGKKPLLKLNQLNGKSMAYFDGSDDLLVSTFSAGQSQPNFMAVVVRLVNGGHALSGREGTSGTSTSHAMGENGAGAFSLFNGSTLTGGTHGPAEYYILTYRFHGTAGATFLRANGVEQFTGTGGTRSIQQLGFGGNARDALWSECYVGEVIFYNVSIAQGDLRITRVEEYLADKWGISI